MLAVPCRVPQNIHIIHFPGVRVLGLILFCFCICFVLRITYCATLRFCHADVDSRAQQAILLKKMKKIRPKLCFSCFSGEDFGTILSRRSRLSRTSRAPSRLIRPRPIDCDAGPKRTVKSFPGFGQFIFRTSYRVQAGRPKKSFLFGPYLSRDY